MSQSWGLQVCRKMFYDLVPCLASLFPPNNPFQQALFPPRSSLCVPSSPCILPPASFSSLQFSSLLVTLKAPVLVLFISLPFPSFAAVEVWLSAPLLGLVVHHSCFFCFLFFFVFSLQLASFYFFRKTNLMCEVFMAIQLRAHCSCYSS